MTMSSPVVVAVVPPPAAPPQARASIAARLTTLMKRVTPPIMRTLYSLCGALPDRPSFRAAGGLTDQRRIGFRNYIASEPDACKSPNQTPLTGPSAGGRPL